MKVVVSAYACEPGSGSEPGAGWVWARAAALHHDVWLLTRENNAEKIEAAMAEEPALRLTPVYLDLPAWARRWKRGQQGVHLYYLLWQILVRRKARHLHEHERFDVAHHLTFAVDWMPAGIVGIPGLPAVWGPVGGATGSPWNLWRWLGWRGIVAEVVRELTTGSMRRLFGDRAARATSVIVAQNHDVGARFRRSGTPTVIEPNPAFDVEQLRDLADSPSPVEDNGARRQAVFAGRLVPWKGLRLAVASLAETDADAACWELHVFGDGPERGPAAQLAQRLAVEDRVQFHGTQPRAATVSAIRQAEALLMPSMHDAAGWAVAEAVTLGTAVICLDRGGPPVIADHALKVGVRGGNRPRAIAAALHVTPSTVEPCSRWSCERLPRLLTDWYHRARRDDTGEPG